MTDIKSRYFAARLVAFSVCVFLGSNAAGASDPVQTDAAAIYPATPRAHAEAYVEASMAMDVGRIAALASEHVTSMTFRGEPQTTVDKAQQIKDLHEFYGVFAKAGRRLHASDYIITQLSPDFAIVRFTWVIEQDGADVVARVNSSCVLRLEDEGWRFVAILEHGAPKGPVSQD